jgi:multiple sugar transport system permease protein
MTVQQPTAATARPAPQAATEVGPVGDRSLGLRRRLAFAILIVYALLMFIPFAWTVITSFKTQPDALQLTWVPDPFTIEGWETAFTQLNPTLPRLFFNSAIIAGAVTLSNVALGSMAGYAFARLRFRGREILFLLVLATMMIPDQLRLVPVYILLNNVVDLVNTNPTNYLSVVVVLAIQAESVFLLRQYFLTIPRELEEAAKIDGAGFFTTFARIILPLGAPAIAAVAILQFQGAWNNFFWPLVLLGPARDHWTLPLGLAQFRFLYDTNWPALCAVVVMATIPILVLYLFFQRYFVAGVAASGVKG